MSGPRETQLESRVSSASKPKSSSTLIWGREGAGVSRPTGLNSGSSDNFLWAPGRTPQHSCLPFCLWSLTLPLPSAPTFSSLFPAPPASSRSLSFLFHLSPHPSPGFFRLFLLPYLPPTLPAPPPFSSCPQPKPACSARPSPHSTVAKPRSPGPTCTGASSGVSTAPARRPSRGARRLLRPLGPSPGVGLLGSGGTGVLRGGDSPSFSGGSFSALPGVGASVPWLPSSWWGKGAAGEDSVLVPSPPLLPRPSLPGGRAHLQDDGELAGAVVIAVSVQHSHEEPVSGERPPGAQPQRLVVGERGTPQPSPSSEAKVALEL